MHPIFFSPAQSQFTMIAHVLGTCGVTHMDAESFHPFILELASSKGNSTKHAMLYALRPRLQGMGVAHIVVGPYTLLELSGA